MSFKFENMWLKAEGFMGKVKQWWDSYSFQGTSSFAFACKLKALKKDLKSWNEEVFGKVDRNKRKFFEDLRAFDAIEGSRALVEKELQKKTEIVREIERCSLLEEVSWRQKSRVLWLKEGDKCTKFFHSIANSNRRYNSIDSLWIGDTLLISQILAIMWLSSTKSSFMSRVGGGLGWMVFLLILFQILMLASWRERSKRRSRR